MLLRINKSVNKYVVLQLQVLSLHLDPLKSQITEQGLHVTADSDPLDANAWCCGQDSSMTQFLSGKQITSTCLHRR